MARRADRQVLMIATAALWIAAFGAPSAAGKTLRIVVDNVAFSPAEADVTVGDTIEWVNRDFLAHTATAGDGKWELILPPGATKQLQIKEPATLDYYCRYHPNMKGKISVGR